jgi:hypothetical protein
VWQFRVHTEATEGTTEHLQKVKTSPPPNEVGDKTQSAFTSSFRMLSLPCSSYSGRRRRRSLEVLLQELRNPSTQDEPEADTMLANSGEGDEDVREFVASHQPLSDWFRRPQVSMKHEKCLGNIRLCSSFANHCFLSVSST